MVDDLTDRDMKAVSAFLGEMDGQLDTTKCRSHTFRVCVISYKQVFICEYVTTTQLQGGT